MKQQSRRDFLAKNILTGAGLLAAQPLLAAAGAATSNDHETFDVPGSKKRRGKLGKLEVTPQGLGGLPVVGFYGGGVREQAHVNKLYRTAYENGVRFFDTAEVYGPMTNETQIGEAIAPFRKEVVLATKFGFNVDPNHQNGRGRALNSRPENIRRAIDGSLKRLRTDYVDLFYQHRVDPEVPIEEVSRHH